MKFWSFLKYTFTEVNTILGVVGTLLTVVCLIDFNTVCPNIIIRALIILGIFAFALIVAFIKTLCTRSTTISLGNGREAKIKFGDLFKEDSTLVIPVNRYFDTIIDDQLIAKDSVHGQFVHWAFSGNCQELDSQIKNDLTKRGITSSFINDEKDGKREGYPVGTVVQVICSGKPVFLLGLTDFDKTVAYCTLEDYYTAIFSLIDYIGKYSQGKTVSMPLVGSGFARLKKDKQTILENMVSVLKMSDSSLIGYIQIVLNPKDWGKINLHTLQ